MKYIVGYVTSHDISNIPGYKPMQDLHLTRDWHILKFNTVLGLLGVNRRLMKDLL